MRRQPREAASGCANSSQRSDPSPRVLRLLGVIWLGQDLNVIKGFLMTGQSQWAIIGAVLLVVAAWLLWSAIRERRLSRLNR